MPVPDGTRWLSWQDGHSLSLVIRHPDGSWKILDSDGQPTIKEGTLPSPEVMEAIYSTLPRAKVEFVEPLLNQATFDLTPSQPHPMIAPLEKGALEAAQNGIVEEIGVTVAKPARDAVVDVDTGELIPHELDGFVVYQRKSDGYFNVSAMCKAAGKLPADYMRLAGTKALMKEAESVMGIPITVLVEIRQGGLAAV